MSGDRLQSIMTQVGSDRSWSTIAQIGSDRFAVSASHVLERAAELGSEAAAPLADARKWLTRADELTRELTSQRAGADTAWARLALRYADGKVTTAAMAAEALTLDCWGFDGPAAKVLVAARAAANHNAADAVRAAVPKVFTALQRIAADVVAESVKLAAKVPATMTDERVVVRGRDRAAAAAWVDLAAPLERWTTVHELAARLMRDGWISGPGNGAEGHVLDYVRYIDPGKLPEDYNGMAPQLKLARAHEAGAGPGLYGWADARVRANRDALSSRGRG